VSGYGAQVVGSILRDGREAYWRVADLLTPEDFADPKMAGLFRLCKQAAANEDHSFDLFVLGDEAQAAGVAESWEVTELATHAIGSSNLRVYAEKLRDEKLRRATRQICAVGAETGDLAEVQRSLTALMEGQPASAIAIYDATKAMMKSWTERYSAGETFTGIRTGYDKIDEYTGGLQPGRLYGIGARAKMGKTILAMNICSNVALLAKRNVAIWSLEMSEEELLQRMVCAEGMVPSIIAQRPKLIDHHEDAWGRWIAAGKRIGEAPIRLSTRTDVTVEQIEAQVRQLHAAGMCDVACIDYLGLIRMPKADRHDLSVAFVTRRFKILAKDLKIPIILVFQLNRGSEKGQAPRAPIPSDARDSGAIEQDLDAMFLLHRPSYYDKQAEKGLRLELAIQRNGPTGVFHLEDRLDCCRFVDTGRMWDETALPAKDFDL
jgi:replicative DNA helicase